MAIKEIITYENPILKSRSSEVIAITEKTRQTLDDMIDTLTSIPGVGALSACQIGVSQRLVILQTNKGIMRLINPRIIAASGEQYDPEGCLSIPGTFGKVRRPKKITVQALDEYGHDLVFNATGLRARCICHEIDHLDGILFIDKIEELVN